MTETQYKKVPIKEIEKNCNSKEKEENNYGYGVRHIQALLYFVCLALGYTSRGHLGVTIVAMTSVRREVDTRETIPVSFNATIIDPATSTEVYIKNVYNTSVSNETDLEYAAYKTYDWPKSTQEMILGSFFLGYCIMMFPGGLICQRWGGKIPLQIAMFVNGVVSLFSPWFIEWGGWKIFCALRMIQGVSQSGLYPAIQMLLPKWIPLNERASISSFVYSAAGIGTVIAFQSAGILASTRFGWPSTFWVSGVACFIGFILITIFGATTPKDHKSISEAEKSYIMGKIGNNVEKKSVPWKSVFKSVPVWVTMTAHVGNALLFLFFFVEVPTYMYAVLKLNIRNSGILSSLPYLVAFFSSMGFGYMSDYLTNKRNVSVKTARKLFNSIANVIPALCLVIVAYTTNTALAVTLFIIFLSTNIAMSIGWLINYMDLSPNFSGALMATGNTLTNFFMLAMPIFISYIITDVTNQLQWRIAMFLMVAISVGSNMIFVLFMSADVQPWNDSDVDMANEKVESETEVEKLDSKNAGVRS